MALIAGTHCWLEKRPWHLWLEDHDDDVNEVNEDCNLEGDARKVPKTTTDELLTLEPSYERLFFNWGNCKGTDVLLVTQKQLYDYLPAGYISLARLSVDSNAQYKLQVLLHTIESGELESTDHFKELCGRISDYSKYKFCPGLDYDAYMSKCHKKIRYHPSKVQVTNSPIQACPVIQMYNVVQAPQKCICCWQGITNCFVWWVQALAEWIRSFTTMLC